jgi:hypothetical protein
LERSRNQDGAKSRILGFITQNHSGGASAKITLAG